MRFDELGLSPELLTAIADAGYTEPTPIQAAAIPVALAGRDVLGIAQTGTGKTASFTLPMIDKLAKGRAKARMPRSLILTPTRELAAQVAENFEKYGKYHKLSWALLIGGVSFGDQDRILTAGADVLIATPGRLLDHFERGKLLLTGVQVLVIDEADRMLDMGFIPDIERIVKLTPFTRQTLFFSATMPSEIQRLADQFLSNPERIEVARQSTTADTVTQWAVKVPGTDPKSKRAALRAAIKHAKVRTAIIFCNRKRDVDIVARSLARHELGAAPIHGDLPQSVRTATLDRFKDGGINLLVASDVAARGLDITDVSHVFNYDVPRHPEDYVHRIGRTGRAGKSGEAYTLVAPDEAKSFRAVINLIGRDIEYADVDLETGGSDTIVDAPSSRSRGRRDDSEGEGRGRRGRGGAGRARREQADGSDADDAPKVDAQADAASPGSDDASAPVEASTETNAPSAGSEADAPEKTSGRSGSRRRGGRSKSSSDKTASQADAAETGRDEPAAASEPQGAAERSDDDKGRGRGGRSRGGRGSNRGQGRDEGGSDRVVGLGDHTPAFLLRAAPVHEKEPSD